MSKKKFLDLTGLQEYDKGVKNALDNKADKDHTHDFSHNHDDRYAKIDHTHDNLADKNHVHDNRYYTETETDNLLNNKADKDHTHDFSHNHDDIYYNKTELDNKLINYVDLTSSQTITGQKTFGTIYADSVGYFGSTSAFSFNSEGTPTIVNKNGSYFCFMDDSNGEHAGDTFMYTLPYQSGTIALTSDIDGKADKDHTHKEISYSYNGSYNKFTFTDVGDPCVVNKRGRILSISNDTNDTGYYDYTFPEKDGMVVVMNDGCITNEEYEYQFPYLTGTVMIAEETASYEIGKLTLYETLEVYSDNDSEIIEGHGFGDHDIDATYSARGILIYDNDGSGSNREYHLCYPAYKSGTFALTNVDNAFSVTQNITGNYDTPLNLKANHGSMSNIAFFNSSGTRLGNIGVKDYKPYFWAGSGTSGEIALTNDFKTINGQSIVGSGNISISGGSSGSGNVEIDYLEVRADEEVYYNFENYKQVEISFMCFNNDFEEGCDYDCDFNFSDGDILYTLPLNSTDSSMPYNDIRIVIWREFGTGQNFIEIYYGTYKHAAFLSGSDEMSIIFGSYNSLGSTTALFAIKGVLQ